MKGEDYSEVANVLNRLDVLSSYLEDHRNAYYIDEAIQKAMSHLEEALRLMDDEEEADYEACSY